MIALCMNLYVTSSSTVGLIRYAVLCILNRRLCHVMQKTAATEKRLYVDFIDYRRYGEPV